ncbi:MAG: hypothetical protein HQ591_08465 [candidate division Zixibacteria bacterium]|nr:hypothetical protein [Candidatus Tariuqbacter arcticus]
MTETVFELAVPQLQVNDDFAEIVEWIVPDEAKVSKGDTVCVLESAKAVYDIEAAHNGYLLHLVEEYEEVKVGAAIALIGSDLEETISKREQYFAHTSPAGKGKTPAALDFRATKKAAALAEKLRVDLSQISGKDIIREQDVRLFAAGDKFDKTISAAVEIEPVSSREPGFVSPDFLKLIENDPAFPNLTSELKIHLYRKFGANIGDNVRIGKGALILSRALRLEDEAEIGQDAFIKTDRFQLGRMSVIGKKANIATREVIIGDVLFSGENILIGGGNAFGPYAKLNMGDNCLISSDCILNTGEGITIGNEVGLSPNVQLYTHNHWQNVMKGYGAKHAPITIEDEVYITGGCILVPGVHIGTGATVLANSVVAASVEPLTIVSGIPAKVVGRTNTNLSFDQKERIARRLFQEMCETLKITGFDPAQVEFQPIYDDKKDSQSEVVLCLKAENLSDKLEKPVVFELIAQMVHGAQFRLSDEVRNFLRRRGIRFKPIYWRYNH